MQQLFRPFINPAPHTPEAELNDAMATVSASVEWSFGMVTNTFQAVDFTLWQRVFLTRPGTQYKVLPLDQLHFLHATDQHARAILPMCPSCHDDYLNGNV